MLLIYVVFLGPVVMRWVAESMQYKELNHQRKRGAISERKPMSEK
jgi:hypothetical protein